MRDQSGREDDQVSVTTYLEGGGTVDGQAAGENADETGGRQASGDDSGIGVTQRSELDERTGKEEAVGETDLHTTEDRGHTGAVSWEVGQVSCDDWGGGDRGLQHANERIAVQRGDDLLLGLLSAHTNDACRGRGNPDGRGLQTLEPTAKRNPLAWDGNRSGGDGGHVV